MSGFRRLVLELSHGAADPATMRQAAGFARLLDAELHALFVEDETLLHASALPFAREISPLSLRWRKLAPDDLEADLKAEADLARRHLMEAARATGVHHHFEVRRGDLSLQVAEICVASDIVVVSSPHRMAGEATHGAHRLRDTALASAASVLFLPPSAGRPHGPVVAVLSGAEDPSLAVARRIADQGKERLLVLGTSGEAAIQVPPDATPDDIVAALGDTRERLIVITRDGSEEGAELAVARGVPVLVVEPV
jgi:hypothetical protein